MHITSINQTLSPLTSNTGEILSELIGRPAENGGTSQQSLAYVVIPPHKSSPAHYHKVMEETYYILRGEARMIINDKEYTLQAGQACLIQFQENHQIFNEYENNLEFLAICTPAWYPQDSYTI
jgi:mannose-6-phosphate isomerase-like protein (cupin superfamily)